MRASLLIVNPLAGHVGTSASRWAEDLGRTLRSSGFDGEIVLTEGPGHATELAHQAVTAEVEVVFVAGGDGTVREAAAGLLGSRLPLAILPAGTVNVLALCLGVPRRPLAAAGVFDGTRDTLETVDIDVGRCGSRLFLMMVSLGLDARALGGLDPLVKRRLGRAAVVGAGLRAWWHTPYPLYECCVADRSWTGTFVCVSNIPYYGGPFKLVPAASFQDRSLDALVFRGQSRLGTLAFAFALVGGAHLRNPDVVTASAPTVRIDGGARAWAQLDGDPLELDLPVEIGLSESRLRLLLPRRSASGRR